MSFVRVVVVMLLVAGLPGAAAADPCEGDWTDTAGQLWADAKGLMQGWLDDGYPPCVPDKVRNMIDSFSSDAEEEAIKAHMKEYESWFCAGFASGSPYDYFDKKYDEYVDAYAQKRGYIPESDNLRPWLLAQNDCAEDAACEAVKLSKTVYFESPPEEVEERPATVTRRTVPVVEKPKKDWKHPVRTEHPPPDQFQIKHCMAVTQATTCQAANAQLQNLHDAGFCMRIGIATCP